MRELSSDLFVTIDGVTSGVDVGDLFGSGRPRSRIRCSRQLPVAVSVN
jgi:hypothetical protein